MRIEFEMEELGIEDNELFIAFCRYLLNSVREDVNKYKYSEQIISKENSLIESKAIDWIEKPKHLNMSKLVKFIANHIVCIIRENSLCVITINTKIRMPGSRTPLSVVVKYLDKGDLKTVGTHFIGSVFIEHKRNIVSYWNEFLEVDRKKRSIDEVATII